MSDLERILRETRSVAIVGASAHPWRASHQVWTYLKSASDYELYLVNPTISEVDGTPVYPSLADLPVVPDLVDVFRRRDHLPSVLDDTIEVGAKTLWLQLGLRHEQVGHDGAAAGLQVVMDRCLKVDHARLLGEREWIGDTSFTSQRPSSLDNVTRSASTAVSGGLPGTFCVPRMITATLAAPGPIASTPAETVLA